MPSSSHCLTRNSNRWPTTCTWIGAALQCAATTSHTAAAPSHVPCHWAQVARWVVLPQWCIWWIPQQQCKERRLPIRPLLRMCNLHKEEPTIIIPDKPIIETPASHWPHDPATAALGWRACDSQSSYEQKWPMVAELFPASSKRELGLNSTQASTSALSCSSGNEVFVLESANSLLMITVLLACATTLE